MFRAASNLTSFQFEHQLSLSPSSLSVNIRLLDQSAVTSPVKRNDIGEFAVLTPICELFLYMQDYQQIYERRRQLRRFRADLYILSNSRSCCCIFPCGQR